jgi:hypothetical protein
MRSIRKVAVSRFRSGRLAASRCAFTWLGAAEEVAPPAAGRSGNPARHVDVGPQPGYPRASPGQRSDELSSWLWSNS